MERDHISRGINEEEIKVALWSLKPFKAPRSDGLHAGFFQNFWPVVGDSVSEEVKKVFVSRKVPDFLNRTLIALISKDSRVGDFRKL